MKQANYSSSAAFAVFASGAVAATVALFYTCHQIKKQKAMISKLEETRQAELAAEETAFVAYLDYLHTINQPAPEWYYLLHRNGEPSGGPGD